MKPDTVEALKVFFKERLARRKPRARRLRPLGRKPYSTLKGTRKWKQEKQ